MKPNGKWQGTHEMTTQEFLQSFISPDNSMTF